LKQHIFRRKGVRSSCRIRFADLSRWHQPARPSLLLCLLSLAAVQAIGQEATPLTPSRSSSTALILRQRRGIISTNVSGIEQRDASTTRNNLLISPSSTVGELITCATSPGRSPASSSTSATPAPPRTSLSRPARPEPAAKRANRRPRAHTRLRRPHAEALRRPALPRRRGGTISFKPTPNAVRAFPFSTAPPTTTTSASKTPSPAAPATSASV